MQTVRDDGAGGYIVGVEGYPDFPLLQRPRGDRAKGRVTISCQITGVDFVWQVAEDRPGTRIDVHLALPDSEVHQFDTNREIITTSLAQLVTVAETAMTS